MSFNIKQFQSFEFRELLSDVNLHFALEIVDHCNRYRGRVETYRVAIV